MNYTQNNPDTAHFSTVEVQLENTVPIPFKLPDSVKTKVMVPKSLFHDSLRYKNIESQYVPSLFLNTSEKKSYGTPAPKPQYYSNWMFALLVLGLLIFSRLRYQSFLKINMVLKAVFVARVYNQMEREGNILENRISISLYAMFLISVTLLIFISIQNRLIAGTQMLNLPANWFLLLSVFTLVVVISVAKNAMNLVLSYIFKSTKPSRDYRLNGFLIDISIGMVILPLVFILSYLYTDGLAVMIWGVLMLYYAVKLFKGIIIWLPYANIFKIFLYFCAVEILPLMIVVKYFINQCFE